MDMNSTEVEDSGPLGIDPATRDRVLEQIRAVSEALDITVVDRTNDKRDELRKAADALMRALGRIILELERKR